MSDAGLKMEDFIPKKTLKELMKGDFILDISTGQFFEVMKVSEDRVSGDREESITMAKIETRGPKRGDRYEKTPDIEVAFPTGTLIEFHMWVEPEPEPAPPKKKWWQ